MSGKGSTAAENCSPKTTTNVTSEDFNDEYNCDEDDDASFKSALDMPLHESFIKYSSSYVIPPQSFVNFCDNTSMSDSLVSEQFEDALDFLTLNEEQVDEENKLISTTTEYGNNNKPVVHYHSPKAEEHMETIEKTLVRTTPNSDKPVTNREDQSDLVSSIMSKKSEWVSIKQKRERATIQAMSFNQDKTCISIATDAGYIIRTIPQQNGNNTDSVVRIHQVSIPKGGTTHIQILHCTSLLAIVKKCAPRVLILVHAKTARIVKELPFTSAVRRIEMNKMSLVVLTADGVLHIFMFYNVDFNVKNRNAGIEFVERIPILHSSESARMITARAASTSGAFFDLCSHISEAENNTNIEDLRKRNRHSESFLVTKSAEGVGMVSLYSSTFSRSQNEEKSAFKLIKSFSAHSHSIMRIVMGGANDQTQHQKVLATASVKVCIFLSIELVLF